MTPPTVAMSLKAESPQPPPSITAVVGAAVGQWFWWKGHRDPMSCTAGGLRAQWQKYGQHSCDTSSHFMMPQASIHPVGQFCLCGLVHPHDAALRGLHPFGYVVHRDGAGDGNSMAPPQLGTGLHPFGSHSVKGDSAGDGDPVAPPWLGTGRPRELLGRCQPRTAAALGGGEPVRSVLGTRQALLTGAIQPQPRCRPERSPFSPRGARGRPGGSNPSLP